MNKNKKKVYPKKSPSLSWVGIVGLNPDSADGVKRSGGLVFDNIRGENVG